MTVLICSRTKSIFNLFKLLTVSVSYLSKTCTTCLFISKSFKELFFMAFFPKADAKVRTFSELPKLFRSFFQKVFFDRSFILNSVSHHFNAHPRFSLESGCKSTALEHIRQTSGTLFCWLFAFAYVSNWFSKCAVQHKIMGRKFSLQDHTLILLHARV